MRLDTTSNTTLWKDQALVEVNIAVLHSFQVLTLSIKHVFLVQETLKKFQQASIGSDSTCICTSVIIKA